MDFSDVTQLLEQVGSETRASESHGLLCGLLCTQTVDRAKVGWFTEVLKELQGQPGMVSERAREIRQLDTYFSDSVEQLNASQFEFQLLLPLDSESIDLRVESLALWCSGFSYGFGLGGMGKSDKSLPEDTRELLQDFQQIARSDSADPATADEATSDGTESDETEQDFVELEEYVRVGVMVINEEMQPPIRSNQSSVEKGSLH